MALTKPRFAELPESSFPQSKQGERKKSIFDIEAYVTNVKESTKAFQNIHGLKTTNPVFRGKEKPVEAIPSIFDVDAYGHDYEDPGVYSLTHFDEPQPFLRRDFDTASLGDYSLASVGHFNISPDTLVRSRGSFFPYTPNSEFATHYYQGLRYPATEPEEPFNFNLARKIMVETLSYLEDEEYEREKCRKLSKNLSDFLLFRLKALQFDRYKFVCQVHVGQNLGQGMQVASRSLWNSKTDNYISESYTTKDIFATATVFAIYQE